MAVSRESSTSHWHGFYGDETLLLKFSNTLNDIINNKKSTHFESLHAGQEELYSARVNGKEGDTLSERLLFTTLIVEGKRCLLLIGHVTKHRYHRSEFVKSPQSIKKHVAKYTSSTSDQHRDSDKSFLQEIENPGDINQDLAFIKKTTTRLHFHQDQIIFFNDEQQKAIEIHQFPLIISGQAGSGKTAVIESLLPQLVERAHRENKSIVVLTKSKGLCLQNQKDWLQSALYQEKYKDTVLFFTDEMLLSYLNIEDIQGFNFINLEESLEWISNLKKKKNSEIQKLFSYFKTKNISSPAHYIYQEFRIFSAYTSEPDNYLALGNKQSLISKELHQIRITLINVYREYIDYLKNTKLIDPVCYNLGKQFNQYFHSLLVDEGLDLSLLQQESYYRIAERLIISHDPQQRLFDSLSNRQHFISLLTSRYSEKPQLITLPYSYRSAKRILTFLQAIRTIENNLSGGIADRYDHASIEGSPNETREGSVNWLIKQNNELSSDQLSQLYTLSDSHECAFIIYAGNDANETASKKSFIKNTYGARIILTVEEAKGHGFKYIVLCDLILPEIFGDANALIDINDFKTHTNKPKNADSPKKFTVALNHLGVAGGRAIEHLYIIHTPHYKTEKIFYVLKNYPTLGLFTEIAGGKQDAYLPSTPSTPSEWAQQEEKLLAHGIAINKKSSDKSKLLPSPAPKNTQRVLLTAMIANFFDPKQKNTIYKLPSNPDNDDYINGRESILSAWKACQKYPDLLEKFMVGFEEVFTKTIAKGNQDRVRAVLVHSLSSTEDKTPDTNENSYLKILSMLIKRLMVHFENPSSSILNDFIKALCQPLTSKNNAGKSALWWLSSDGIGNDVLDLIISSILNKFNNKKDSPVIISFLTMLFQPLPTTTQDQTCFWWLTSNIKGINIISRLLPLLKYTLISEKQKFIDLSSLLINTLCTSKSGKRNPFTKFSYYVLGTEIIEALLPLVIQKINGNKTASESIKINFITKLFAVNSGTHLLHRLADSENNNKITYFLFHFLEKTLADKRDPASYICADLIVEALCLDTEDYVSVLWQILGLDNNIPLLKLLMRIMLINGADPQLEENRFLNHIIPAFSYIQYNTCISTIRLFSDSIELIKLLKKILPLIIKYLPYTTNDIHDTFLESWLIWPVLEDGIDDSPLFFLADTIEGWKVITLIMPLLENAFLSNKYLADLYIDVLTRSKNPLILNITNVENLKLLLNCFYDTKNRDYLFSKIPSESAVHGFLTKFFKSEQLSISSTMSIFSHNPKASHLKRAASSGQLIKQDDSTHCRRQSI